MEDVPEFRTMPHEDLVNHAIFMYNKLSHQFEHIQRLQCERNDALEAYRDLLRKTANQNDD